MPITSGIPLQPMDSMRASLNSSLSSNSYYPPERLSLTTCLADQHDATNGGKLAPIDRCATSDPRS